MVKEIDYTLYSKENKKAMKNDWTFFTNDNADENVLWWTVIKSKDDFEYAKKIIPAVIRCKF